MRVGVHKRGLSLYFMKIHTMTKGFMLKVTKSLSKGQFIDLCKDLEALFGPGNRFEPLKGKGLLWSEWPGKVAGGFGSKEIRLGLHTYGGQKHVVWPVFEEGRDNRALWEFDPSLALLDGYYSTLIVAFGDVPKWTGKDLELVRECLQRQDIRVSSVKCIRRLRYKDDALTRRFYPQQVFIPG